MTDYNQRNQQITRLLLQHRSTLYGYIFSCVRNHSDAEDILQEVALAITGSIDKLEEESGFLLWAMEIARRRVLVHVRKSKRTTILSPELIPVLYDAVVRVTLTNEIPRRNEALLECLEALPAENRELIVRRYDGSNSGVDQLASELGRTIQATYGVLKRIRMRLRQCIENKLSGESV